MTPYDLVDIAVLNGLHFHAAAGEGVAFHLIGALSEFGKLGSSASEKQRRVPIISIAELSMSSIANAGLHQSLPFDGIAIGGNTRPFRRGTLELSQTGGSISAPCFLIFRLAAFVARLMSEPGLCIG